MVRKVDRQYLIDLVKQNYYDQELFENCTAFFVEKIIVNFVKNQGCSKKNLGKENSVPYILMLWFGK